MNTYTITVQQLCTLEARVINVNPPSGEPLHININRNIRKLEDATFSCVLTASIYREADEKNENKDFLVKYSVNALVACSDATASADDIQEEVTRELYPHIRASIASIMGASGVEPILLPPILKK